MLNISSTVETDDFQLMYKIWSKMVEGSISQVQTKVKKQNRRIKVKKLQELNKEVKTQLKKTTDKKEREVLISRIRIMNEHIELQQEKTETKRIAKIVEQLKEKIGVRDPKYGI